MDVQDTRAWIQDKTKCLFSIWTDESIQAKLLLDTRRILMQVVKGALDIPANCVAKWVTQFQIKSWVVSNPHQINLTQIATHVFEFSLHM